MILVKAVLALAAVAVGFVAGPVVDAALELRNGHLWREGHECDHRRRR